MVEKVHKMLLATTASAVPNNLAVHQLGKFRISYAIGVIHGGHINIVPLEETCMRSKYVPCFKTGSASRKFAVRVTQVKWCCVNNEQLLFVTSSLGLKAYDDQGTKCWYTHPCIDSEVEENAFARGMALIGDLLCVGNSTGTIRIFRISNKQNKFKFLKKMPVLQKGITDLASDEKSLLAAADDFGTIIVYNITYEYKKRLFTFHRVLTITCPIAIQSFGFQCLCVHIWKNLILAGYSSGHIRIFDSKGGGVVHEIKAYSRQISGMDIASCREFSMLSVSEDSWAKIWGYNEPNRHLVLKYSIFCENRSLIGGRFLNSLGTEFCVSAVDSNEVFCYSV